jgi:hypothetical protein
MKRLKPTTEEAGHEHSRGEATRKPQIGLIANSTKMPPCGA